MAPVAGCACYFEFVNISCIAIIKATSINQSLFFSCGKELISAVRSTALAGCGCACTRDSEKGIDGGIGKFSNAAIFADVHPCCALDVVVTVFA